METFNKLHIGCGKVRIPGYLNIDIQKTSAVDVLADVRKLPLIENHFDLIYACAVIEHFGRHEWLDIVAHWSSFLKPGGILRLSTNDFESCVARFQQKKDLSELLGILIGGHKDPWDKHGMIFTFDVLRAALEKIGFSQVRRYDWRQTDYGQMGIDDFSQAYLPHMDKENGRLMVLNVEAVKEKSSTL